MVTKTPSISREINIQKKRIYTLERLEKSLASFVDDVKKIQIDCPFGSESVETQEVVTEALKWCTDFNGYLAQVFNVVINRHHDDVNHLHGNAVAEESPKEVLEDMFAIYKTHLTPELKASRVVRTQDEEKGKIFMEKLTKLQEEYIGASKTMAYNQNLSSEHYSLVE